MKRDNKNLKLFKSVGDTLTERIDMGMLTDGDVTVGPDVSDTVYLLVRASASTSVLIPGLNDSGNVWAFIWTSAAQGLAKGAYRVDLVVEQDTGQRDVWAAGVLTVQDTVEE